MHQITCSIVLYQNDRKVVEKAVESVLQTNLDIKLYLVDNSPIDDLKKIACAKTIDYIFNNKNLGFGNAHNIALQKAVDAAPYHLVLNPDIEFENGVIEEIFAFMQKHEAVGQLMPKVFYDNGDLQKLCHLLPTPADLIGRRFFQQSKLTKKLNDRYELNDFDYNGSANIPNLSGCFMFLRTAAIKRIGFFDDRFFMYMEDVDFTRRMHRLCETLYYPHVNIMHKFEKESYSNPVLMRYHINSAIKYFNKWGWMFDNERRKINESALKRLNLGKSSDIPLTKLERSRS